MATAFLRSLQGNYATQKCFLLAGNVDNAKRKAERVRNDLNRLNPTPGAKPSDLIKQLQQSKVETEMMNTLRQQQNQSIVECAGLVPSVREALQQYRSTSADPTRNRINDITKTRRAALEYVDATMRWRQPDETIGLQHLTATLQIPPPALLEAGGSVALDDLRTYMGDQTGKTSWSMTDVIQQLRSHHHERKMWESHGNQVQVLQKSVSDTEKNVDYYRSQNETLTADRQKLQNEWEQARTEIDQKSKRLQASVAREWHEAETQRLNRTHQKEVQTAVDLEKEKHRIAVDLLKSKYSGEKTESSKTSDSKINDLKLELERCRSQYSNADMQVEQLRNQIDKLNAEVTAADALASAGEGSKNNLIDELRKSLNRSYQSIDDVRRLNTELDQKQRRIGNELADVQCQLEGCKAELQNCRNTLADSQTEFTEERQELTRKLESLNDAVVMKDALELTVLQMETETLPGLRNEINQLTLERDGARNAQQLSHTESQQFKASADGLTSRVGNLEGTNQELQTRVTLQSEQLAKAEEATEELREDLKALEKEKEESLRKLQERFNRMEISDNEKGTRLVEATKELSSVKPEIEELRNERPSLEQARTDLQEIYRLLKEYQPSMLGTPLEIQALLNQLQEQVRELKSNCVNLEANNQALTVSFGPLLEATLPEQTISQNIRTGLRVMPGSTRSDHSFTVATAQALEWNLAMVPSELFTRYTIDESLPRRLWLYTCCNDSDEAVLTLIELIAHALNHGQSFAVPESPQMVLTAATNAAQRITRSANPHMTAICALRALELALRFGSPVATRKLNEVLKLARSSYTEHKHDPLFLCLDRWIAGLLRGPTDPSTPLDELDVMNLDLVTTWAPPKWALPEELMRRTAYFTTCDLLVADRANNTISQYPWNSVQYSFEAQRYPLRTITFTVARRLDGELSTIQKPFQTSDNNNDQNTEWFVRNMSQHVRTWSLRKTQSFLQAARLGQLGRETLS